MDVGSIHCDSRMLRCHIRISGRLHRFRPANIRTRSGCPLRAYAYENWLVSSICRIPPPVWVKNVGAAEGFSLTEIIYGAYACHKDCQQGDQYERDDGFAQCDRYFSQHVNQSSFIWMQCVSHKLMAEDNCCKVNKNAARAKGKIDV